MIDGNPDEQRVLFMEHLLRFAKKSLKSSGGKGVFFTQYASFKRNYFILDA
jgi:hypothetical protein